MPCVSDRARSAPSKRSFPPSPSAMPRKICEAMTPELPRAPMRAPKLIAVATRSADCSATPSASARAARTVASMLLPVSPSGTGKTFRALTSSTWSARLSTAARKAASRPAPSPARRVIGKLDASSGPASSRSRLPLGRCLVGLVHAGQLPGRHPAPVRPARWTPVRSPRPAPRRWAGIPARRRGSSSWRAPPRPGCGASSARPKSTWRATSATGIPKATLMYRSRLRPPSVASSIPGRSRPIQRESRRLNDGSLKPVTP